MNLKQKLAFILLHLFWLVPINRRKIVFFSYGATKYNCSPRRISEYLHEKSDNQIDIIWFYTNDDIKQQIPDYAKKYKKNTFMYFLSILTAGTIVTNVTFPRVTPFRKRQLRINTWHGTAFKGDNNSFGNNYNIATYMIAENQLTHDVYRRKDSFNYTGKILDTGMPRNDILINYQENSMKKIKKSMLLPCDAHVVLYAPTFRDTGRNDFLGIDFQSVTAALSERFGGQWLLLFRYHPKQLNRISFDSGIDVTDYPEMQDLLLIADILITDYSSCMWDFSLLERPVFLYANDIEQYTEQERGDFYFPFGDLPFPSAQDSESLLDRIKSFDGDKYKTGLITYFNKFGRFNYKGDATQKIVSLIKEEGIGL